MDLDRVKDDEKVKLCRLYYLGGFGLLPFLWFINTVWFFKEAFFREAFEQQKQIRSYVIRSLIGVVIWTAIIITWVTVFQLNRASWGVIGDNLSFVIPKGRA